MRVLSCNCFKVTVSNRYCLYIWPGQIQLMGRNRYRRKGPPFRSAWQLQIHWAFPPRGTRRRKGCKSRRSMLWGSRQETGSSALPSILPILSPLSLSKILSQSTCSRCFLCFSNIPKGSSSLRQFHSKEVGYKDRRTAHMKIVFLCPFKNYSADTLKGF